ncbi:MAG TPA: penicillin-binding protein 2, partial [Alphaproteobacteria bacterium]|nr:penicillin-binding protein 2 [Alphaproteobacteria bacterium]
MQLKIKLLCLVFAILFLGLISRLFYWQVVKSSELSQQAKSQYSSSKITQAPRGNILASDGSFWVVRTDAWLVYANTNIMTQTPASVANKLGAILDEDIDKLQALLSKKSSWISLKQKVDNDVKNNIEALKITGIGFENQESQYYPEASSSAQVLGFVGKDDNGEDIGYFGLEGYYNIPLSGKSGFIGRDKDAKGAPILLAGAKQINAVSGVDLKTSIDKRIQFMAEEKLKEGIEKYRAKGGSVTIMNPTTGAIMAMASSPSYDPQNYREYSDEVFKNPVISNTFEPGSIFKVIVMAAGLDKGVVTPDTPCDICGQSLKIDKFEIKTWNNKYTPNLSMTNVIVNSDNVGMSFVGQKLGADVMYDYLTKFGIGKKTGIDLQGETPSKLREKGTWNIVDLATASFGQGVAVTGIQMVRAVAAIANGGYLVTPHVVESIRGTDWEEKTKADKPEHIISTESASETTQMMVEAVDRGEAKWTKIPGYKVAGKTGTAQIPVAGHYDPTNTNHS